MNKVKITLESNDCFREKLNISTTERSVIFEAKIDSKMQRWTIEKKKLRLIIR